MGRLLVLLLLAGCGSALGADPEEEPRSSPFLRLELWGRTGPPVDATIKLGREGEATRWKLRHDARRPSAPSWGYGANLDLEVTNWASVGLTGWEIQQPTGRRRIHYEGIDLDGRVFPGDTRLTTRIELQFAELSLRYVWRNDGRVRLWFGIGAAWLSTRLSLRGANGQRATTRWSNVFAPSLSYSLTARVFESFELFLLSAIAFAPTRFPSLTTRYRLGLGYELTPGFSIRLAVSLRSAFLGETREQLTKRARPGHDGRRIRWNSFGVEFGFAFSL